MSLRRIPDEAGIAAILIVVVLVLSVVTQLPNCRQL